MRTLENKKNLPHTQIHSARYKHIPKPFCFFPRVLLFLCVCFFFLHSFFFLSRGMRVTTTIQRQLGGKGKKRKEKTWGLFFLCVFGEGGGEDSTYKVVFFGEVFAFFLFVETFPHTPTPRNFFFYERIAQTEARHTQQPRQHVPNSLRKCFTKLLRASVAC